MGLNRREFLAVSLYAAAQAYPATAAQPPSSPLIIGFRGTKPNESTVKSAVDHLRLNRASGLIFFERNIESKKQLLALTNHVIRSLGENNGRLLCVDQEGGSVQRLNRRNGFISIPSAEEIAAERTLDEAEQIFDEMCNVMAAAKINFNFAPVVDVNLNRKNPIIGKLGRSFSSSPDVVIEYTKRFINAHKKWGIGNCLKHFPGHGSALTDSHLTITDITKQWRPEIELTPYKSIVANSVMVGHLRHAMWSGSAGYPSSLSEVAINDILRRKVGFKGAVFIDDLQMNSISSQWSTEEAAILALKAGADFLIVGNVLKYEPDIPIRFERALHNALTSGRLSKTEFLASSRRRAKLLESLVFS